MDFSRVAGSATVTDPRSVDKGLRTYLLRVYNHMAAGLAVTGIAALFAYYMAVTGDASASSTQIGEGLYLTGFGRLIFSGPIGFVLLLAPLGLAIFLNSRISTMSVLTAQLSFGFYSLLMGVSLSSVFLVYTSESITKTFFVAAAMFGSMSLFGHTTKRDLSSWGSFLFMGLIGIIIASVVNIFLASSLIGFMVSVAGVLVFTGLTAYDNQKIRAEYNANASASEVEKGRRAVLSALSLYLNFINLLLMLLRLMGNERQR
ncbi:MAG: Bax inhibitor-1/YccA family protein [Alphaproteobacteria bacterium]|nr:Bax inhibitor-1/YccA family protein [Alphaproteobacteria bacterium]